MRVLVTFAAAALIAAAFPAQAQDMEPRIYSNAPVGMNFAIVGGVHASGGVSFDPAVPITEPDLRTNSAVVAYARVLDLWGRSGKFDMVLPYTWLEGTALYRGEPVERIVDGLNDPAFRLSVLLYGGPALIAAQFAGHQSDVVVGASLRVTAPLGQYDESRLVNIGANRWTIRPELGVSKTQGPWTFEVSAAGTWYTDNDEFFGGVTREQRPLLSVQGHAVYQWSSGTWIAVDAVYFAGGRSTIGGVLNNDLQQNWRFGATMAIPVDRRNSVKLYASDGVSARTGNNFTLLGIAWQHRWGGGL